MTTPKRTRWNIQSTANGWIIRKGSAAIFDQELLKDMHVFTSIDALVAFMRKELKASRDTIA